MDAISSGYESDTKHMSADMLEDFCDGSQYHLRINTREVRYKIRYSFKKDKRNGKERYYQRDT